MAKNASEMPMTIHFTSGGSARGRARLEALGASERRGVGDDGHYRDLSFERAVQACSALMMSSRTKDTISMTAATAVAPA